jgi:hypothetical protein
MKKDSTKKVGFPLRVDPLKKAQIEEAAKQRGVSENRYINEIVDRDLKAKATEAKRRQEIEAIEQQLDLKFAELEAAVEKNFKPDAIDRISTPEVLRQRITDDATDLLEDWRTRDEGAKPRGTVERLCAEYCKLEETLHDMTTPPQEGKSSGVDLGDDDDDEGEDEGSGIEDVVYDNEFPPDHDE